MFNKKLATIFFIIFADLLGFGIVLPLLPYIAEKYGATPFQLGLLTASYSFFQFFAASFLGNLSDYFGRKKILIISQLGSAVGYLILAASGNLPLIFLSRIIDGATGGNISVAQAYIADITSEKDRAWGMGIIGAAFGLGLIFGPSISGLLSQNSLNYPAYFACMIALITAISSILFLEETVKKKNLTRYSFQPTKFVRKLQAGIRIKRLRTIILTFFVFNLTFTMIQGNLALWLEKTFLYGPKQSGFLFSYIGIVAIIIQIKILPQLLNIYSEHKLIIFGLLAHSLAFCLFGLTHQPLLIFLPLTLMTFGNGIINPVIPSIASKTSPKSAYGEILGILQSAGSLGRIIGPIIGGFIFNFMGKNIVFFTGSVFSILLLVITTRGNLTHN